MADYYPLLMRAISALPENTPAARAAIFARARDALERQLRSIDPPLSEMDLLNEQIGLEDVFRRIEQEFTQEASERPDGSLQPEHALPSREQDIQPVLEEAATSEGDIKPMVTHEAPEASDPAFDALAAQENLPPQKGLHEQEDLPAHIERPAAVATILPSRPKAARPEGEDARSKPRRKGIMIVLAIALPAMAMMAMLALSNTESPDLYKTGKNVERTEPAADIGKTENRFASTEAPAQPAPPPPTRPVTPAQPHQTPAVDASQPALPIAQRAFMVQEARSGSTSPPQFEGRVVWTFTGGANGALKANIEFPSAQLNLDFNIARNTDAALKASHTILMVFEPMESQEGVREISAIEWRERESQQGSTLVGLVVPVQENTFMIGLDKTDFALNRNMELLRTQKWMVFELRFTSGRRAAILIEKGTGGERAITDALAAWK